MNPDTQYTSTISGKGALIPETKAVLHRIHAGMDPEQIRDAVLEENILDRRTWHNRETVWKHIHRRYISGRDPQHVATLARLVDACPNPTAVDLVLFYEYCQVDALLYDLTAFCTYELYQSARTAIDKTDIDAWLGRQKETHAEISEWSVTTRSRVVRSYLSTNAKRKQVRSYLR